MKCPNCKQNMKLIDKVCSYCGYSRNDEVLENNSFIKEEKKVETKQEKVYDQEWVNELIKSAKKASVASGILIISMGVIFTIICFLLAVFDTENVDGEAVFMVAVSFLLIGIGIYTMKYKSYAIKEYKNSYIMAFTKNRTYYIYYDNKEIAKNYVYKKAYNQDYVSLKGYIPNTNLVAEALFKNPIEINILEEKEVLEQLKNGIKTNEEVKIESIENSKFFNPQTKRLECPNCHEFFEKDDTECVECGYKFYQENN